MSRRAKALWVTVMTLTAASALLIATAGPLVAAPDISLSPDSGQPGTAITVSGSGFSPGFTCTLHFTSGSGPPSDFSAQIADCAIDGNGFLSGSVTVPTRPAGSATVWACNGFTDTSCNDEFTERASAAFAVTAPTTTTTTTTTTPTTTTAPTTTTSTPPSTTTTASTSTTTSTTSTTSTTTTVPTTTTTVPADDEIRPLALPGEGVPDLGAGSPLAGALGGSWQPIEAVGDVITMPDVWVMRCGAPPGAHVRDFDDLGRERVFSITEEPEPISLSADSWTFTTEPAIGTFSAPNAVKTPVLPVGYYRTLTTGARIRSDAGFTYLGLMVGLEEAQESSIVVELAALRGFTSEALDVDRIELGPDASPAANCMIVVAPEGETFTRARLSVYGDGVRYPMLIDHVFWSHDEPYPLPASPEAVDVEIVFPRDGARLLTINQTGVVGKVTLPSSLRVDRVMVSAPSWNGRTLIIRGANFGSTTSTETETTQWFWLDNVAVSSGEFQINATAYGRDLRGSARVTLEGIGLPTASPDEYRDVAAGVVDVIPWGLEVTQAVRGTTEVQAPGSWVIDDFPLVAHKKTVVRGYAVQDLPESLGIRVIPLAVDALLHGTRDGETLPGSPLRPESAPVPVFGHAPGPESELEIRPHIGNTFNFVLPRSWTDAGTSELRLSVNPTTSPYHIEEERDRGGGRNSIGRRVTFTDVGEVNVGAVAVELYWRCTEGLIDEPVGECVGKEVGDQVSSLATDGDVVDLVARWWKMLPAPGAFPTRLSYSTVRIAHRDDSPRAAVPDPRISGRAMSVSWSSWRDAFYDLYCDTPIGGTLIRPPSMRTFVMMVTPPWPNPTGGGCAKLGQVAAYRTDLTSHAAAQEAGHTAGLLHASNAHDEIDGGDAVIRWGDDHGEIQPPGESVVGFDTATMSVVLPEPGEHVHDYMSYGPGVSWTSVATWDHMFRALAGNRPVGESRGRVVSAYAGGEMSAFPGEEGDEAVVVGGVVREDGEVILGTPFLAPAGGVLATTGDDVVVSLLDADGAVLAEAVSGLRVAGTHLGSADRTFVVELPAGIDAAELRVGVEGEDPVVRRASDGEVAIEITGAPDGSASIVSWTAEGVEAPFIVELSDDDGASWWQVAVTDELQADLGTVPIAFAGGGWAVRVQGSDGARVASDVARQVDLGIPTPQALIGAPRDGARVTPGMVEVVGMPTVLGMSDTTYLWTVDGEEVASGINAHVAILTEGTHTITLVAANEAGRDEASVTVEAAFDSDGDGLDDAWETRFGLDPAAVDDTADDADGDLLTTATEYEAGTDPTNADTDGDGYDDGSELFGSGDPLDPNVVPGPVHGLDDAIIAAAGPSFRDGGPTPVLTVGILAAVVAAAIGAIEVARRRRRAGAR